MANSWPHLSLIQLQSFKSELEIGVRVQNLGFCTAQVFERGGSGVRPCNKAVTFDPERYLKSLKSYFVITVIKVQY